jgi:prefoldin subunit 5
MSAEEKLDKAIETLERTSKVLDRAADVMEKQVEASNKLTEAAMSMLNAVSSSQEESLKAVVHAIKSSAKTRRTTEDLIRELQGVGDDQVNAS